MREILFRGKQTDKDKWVYGVPCKGTEKDESEMLIIQDVFACDEYLCRGCEFTPVIPETVGQYTGLTDINGKKIFEGDIINCNALYGAYGFRNGIVAWDEILLSWKAGGTPLYGDNLQTYKVIGNIRDNPELLEGKG